jgi:mannose-6-phosphate isomerase
LVILSALEYLTIDQKQEYKQMLYPFKFKPRFVEKIWGGRKIETVLGKSLPQSSPIGESWELYDFPPGVVDKSNNWVSAEIANGALAGRTLHSITEEFGRAIFQF